jgi:transcriptional regulator with PAS, ATPase and Fis domain
MVKEGKFREDLYYRLDVLPLHIPPLRERREDIPLLINNFLAKYNQIHVKDLKISNEAMEALISYDWPGNVRELENIIERVIITTDNNFVKLEDLPGGFRQNIAPISIHVSEIMPLKEALEVVEERLVNLAMEKYKTTTAAAKALGISQASVSRKLKKMRFLPHF